MGEWGIFLKRMVRPFTRLVKNVRFFLYFLIVVCLLGALGTWVPAGQLLFGSESVSSLSVYRNLATYIISIAVTALADCLVRSQDDDNGTLRLFLLGLTVLAVGAAVVVLVRNDLDHVWWLSVLGAFGAAWVWLSVHDSDRDLMPSDNLLSALGGEVSQ